MSRWFSFSGVAAIVVILVGTAVTANAPSGSSSAEKVVAYYGSHKTDLRVSGVLLSVGALLLLVFVAAFAAHLRRTTGVTATAAALCLAGGVVVTVGLALLAGMPIAIADVVGKVSPSSLQTLNVFADDAVFVFLITVGSSVFLIGAAIAVFTGAHLPGFFGWAAGVLAAVGAIPSHVIGGTLDHIGFLAFIGLAVWILIVSVTLARRGPAAPL